ncbi:hypothetical protein [Promicromonospora sp. NFX87]|uniref:hypothetical protein n=1 Tax=Promicromonospora sp. NFX87 TaxID=3402691 RepID=UPI003AFB4D55
MTGKPFVLIVDDDPTQEAFALLLSQHDVDAKHVLPDDLTATDLERASLVLIDEFIENWSAREAVSGHLGLFVRDGVALAGVLRAALEGRGPSHEISPTPKNTALVLRTGHLGVLAAGTPAFIRPIAIASRHDLEWVAEKADRATGSAEAFASLATAAAELPSDWSNPADPSLQLEWLDLGERPWRDEAVAQIELCRPPWSVLAATSAGRRWLAWFMQRVLPFPTFLVDDLRAASYLGLEPHALDELMGGTGPIAELLKGTVYSGQLASFAGRRWWRAGITAVKKLALESATGRTADDIARAVILLHGSDLGVLELRHPVFQIDADYKVIVEPLEITDAVRLQPDDWPTYADDPWLASDAIGSEPALAALIVIDDRYGEARE